MEVDSFEQDGTVYYVCHDDVDVLTHTNMQESAMDDPPAGERKRGVVINVSQQSRSEVREEHGAAVARRAFGQRSD